MGYLPGSIVSGSVLQSVLFCFCGFRVAGRFLDFEGDDRGFGDMIGMSLARLFRQAFGVMILLLQPLLLLPF